MTRPQVSERLCVYKVTYLKPTEDLIVFGSSEKDVHLKEKRINYLMR